ncbi:MAG: SpoIID/LytB domain-containing protein [Spirochaetaceae bacterium]|nr:SpoIID/LytB domain-containing protein [Spirochaetaceae bacterium]
MKKLLIISFLWVASLRAQSPLQLPQGHESFEGLFQHGVNLYYSGNSNGAIEVYRTIIQLAPNFEAAYLELAALYNEQGRGHEAQALYRELYNINNNFSHRRLLFIQSVLVHDFATARSLWQTRGADDWVWFFYGLMLRDEGRYREAISAFDRALALNSQLPAAHYFKGLIHNELQQYALAVTAFTTALRLDANFTGALYPLAVAYEGQGRPQMAINTLVRARNTLAEDRRLQQNINRLVQAYPPDMAAQQAQRLARKEHANPPLMTVFPPEVSTINVRVGVVENSNGLSLKAGGDYTLRDGTRSFNGNAGDILFVRRSRNIITVSDVNDRTLFSGRANANISFSYNDERYTTAVFDIINASGQFFTASVDRNYRGAFEFINRPNGITLVNIVGLEEYLYSVVPSEMPASWPLESLKAQAVAARTYALSVMQLGNFRARGFDLLGTVASQAYTGVNGEHINTTRAVNETFGQILFDSEANTFLRAYYSANNAGYTEVETIVWTGRGTVGRHVAVADLHLETRDNFMPLHQLHSWIESRPLTHSSWPGFHHAASYRSVVFTRAEEVALRVARNNNAGVGDITGLSINRRGVSGRVVNVEALGTNRNVTITSSDAIRSRVGGLRTNLFTTNIKFDADGNPEYFIYYQAGWGHGVGMDQSGAAGMAADNFNYRQILEHYYPNGTVQRHN